MPNVPQIRVENTGSKQPSDLPPKTDDNITLNWAERRQNKRIDITTKLTFQNESNFHMGFTTDISEGGVFVVTWDTVPVGSNIALNFSLPNLKEPIQADGTVRWRREHNPVDPDLWPGIGIQFKALNTKTSQSIHKFIKARTPPS